MLLQSFDNYHQEQMRQKQERLRYLKQQQQQLEQTIADEKEKAFQEAFTKAETDFTQKNQAFIQDVEQFNQQQIETLSQNLQDSIDEQAQHYAQLLSNILHHFMPMIAEQKSLDELVKLIHLLLKTCDNRKIIVIACGTTLDNLTQKINISSKRVSFVADDYLEIGKIKVQYDGGGAMIAQQDIARDIIVKLNEMLGLETIDMPIAQEAFL